MCQRQATASTALMSPKDHRELVGRASNCYKFNSNLQACATQMDNFHTDHNIGCTPRRYKMEQPTPSHLCTLAIDGQTDTFRMTNPSVELSYTVTEIPSHAQIFKSIQTVVVNSKEICFCYQSVACISFHIQHLTYATEFSY